MRRRWITIIAGLLALTALACEGGADAGQPRPTPSESPRAGLPRVMTALGDSVSSGFGSCLTLTSCQRNSWSTGDGRRVRSHYQRLLEVNPAIRNGARNRATPGARAAQLTSQAEAAVSDRADYVTVLIGANDACRSTVDAMTPVATFRAEVDRALRVVKKGRPKARVFVVSIPDLHRLWEVGHTNTRAVRAWRLGVCPALLANPTSESAADVARRAAFRERVTAYNKQLVAACRAYGARCRHDGGAVHRVRLTLDLVNGLDYFHPNAAGQDRLAEVSWAKAGFGD